MNINHVYEGIFIGPYKIVASEMTLPEAARLVSVVYYYENTCRSGLLTKSAAIIPSNPALSIILSQCLLVYASFLYFTTSL